MQNDDKTHLFEQMPVPRAVMKLTVPMVLSSMATIIYNMADTFFVGMLNDPIQSAAVSLAAPLMLAFNVVSNLFGTGTSSMMSRSLCSTQTSAFEGTGCPAGNRTGDKRLFILDCCIGGIAIHSPHGNDADCPFGGKFCYCQSWNCHWMCDKHYH